MSRLMTKLTYLYVRPAKTQISLGIRPVWSESSLCAQWVAKDPSFLHADSEDSDQTRRMPRLIRVFAGRTCHFVCFVTRWLIYGYVAMRRKTYKLWFWRVWNQTQILSSVDKFEDKTNFWRHRNQGSAGHAMIWNRRHMDSESFHLIIAS